MNFVNLLKKAITGGEWFVAYRNRNSDKYELAKAPKGQWCADPFVYEANGEHYIFVEQYIKAKDKGCIGYFRFENGIPVNRGIIIENSYHMSYPCVFKYGDKHYMIPESSANNTIDLYIADHFPDKWRKVKSLITGKKYVDSTVYQDGNTYYMVSYLMVNGYEVHVFILDMKNKNLKLISKKKYEKNIARPGGYFFAENDKLFRPAQNCSRKYGESLIIYQIDALNDNGEFKEHKFKEITVTGLDIDQKPNRLHQLTHDSKFEVVDIFMEKMDLLHGPKIYMRSRRK